MLSIYYWIYQFASKRKQTVDNTNISNICQRYFDDDFMSLNYFWIFTSQNKTTKHFQLFVISFNVKHYCPVTCVNWNYNWAASESSLCAEWVAKDPSFLHADSEDSDQTDLSLRWAHITMLWPGYKSKDIGGHVLDMTHGKLTTL